MNETTDPTVHAARNAWVVARPLLSWTLSTIALGSMLALLGAVDSYAVPIGYRLIFWGGLFTVALVFALGIEAIMLRAGLRYTPVARWWAMFAVILSLAMTPVAYIANSLGGWAPLSMMIPHFGNSMVISIAFVALRIGVGRALWEPDILSTAEHAPAKLMARLPAALREARLHALEADGHYVRVYTDRGSEMILMRLKDAIAETGDLDGMQVHRSWWVAREAVVGNSSIAGKHWLSVHGGVDVPVSRSRRSALNSAGWL
ncbi:LytTR family DNA-binding domain-containing protein [Altererythrobacter sp. MF3-039]|uniref:LytTR family DNA-binding domain-containing protein n=1 Tax=Altererythrobacter sp. MF3-039 TaxID=3252901 RepID=UPI00390CD7FA